MKRRNFFGILGAAIVAPFICVSKTEAFQYKRKTFKNECVDCRGQRMYRCFFNQCTILSDEKTEFVGCLFRKNIFSYMLIDDVTQKEFKVYG